MSAKVETSIWLALKARVESLPLGLPIAWPGQTFEVPHSNGVPSPYLRCGRVSVAPVRMMVADGMPHTRTGSLIVTLVHPLGQDVSVYDQMAASIAEHFKDGTPMGFGAVCVTVTSYPHVQEGYEQDGWWTVPVRIPWRTFA
ncbi:DUF4128 domain-containing protein [Achromobacter sp. GG226]|uniref:DUF4128 domain-containing protein n=1 Tax=Verticiella alkaliphila TaxID=2779529 RepID=UPI001C0C07B3|nr:DUF4128 domain-containing protein [Verticiella sp. GG226]MBU4609134.1 DUF4128 domain-containing protein [Verticiella sp. GG226]